MSEDIEPIPANIKEAHFKDGKWDVSVESKPFADVMRNAITGFWKDNGNPPNYISLRLWVPEIGLMEMVLSKAGGKTPADVAVERAARIAELEKQIAEHPGQVEQAYKEAFADGWDGHRTQSEDGFEQTLNLFWKSSAAYAFIHTGEKE